MSRPDVIRGMRAPANHLLEREKERALVQDSLAAVPAAGRALAFVGPAGIGKTSLVETVEEEATRIGYRTLSARGGALEADLPFALTRQLFGHLDETGGPAALAWPAVADDARERQVPQLEAVFYGLYWLCADLADKAPLVLLVDDVHWADDASLRFLSYLTRRIRDLPALLVVALRPGEGGASNRTLDLLLAEPALSPITVSPLTHDGAAALLGEVLDRPDAEFVSACMDLTGGAPFLLREVAREIAANQMAPRRENVPAVAALTPTAIVRAVHVRLALLPETVRRLAMALSLFAPGANFAIVSRVAELDEATAVAALDRLAQAEIVSARDPTEFAHPLLRSAIYADIPLATRGLQHRRAARLLASSGASPDQVAHHLLYTAPAADADVVSQLLAAGEAAMARAAPVSAILYAERALLETAAEPLRWRVHHLLGRAQQHTGTASAIDHLRRAFAEAPTDNDRATVSASLARELAYRTGGEELDALLTPLIERLGESDPETATEVMAQMLYSALPSPRLAGWFFAQVNATPDDLAGATLAERLLLLLRTYGDARERLPVALSHRRIDRAIAGEALHEPGPASMVRWLAVWVCECFERGAEAQSLCSRALTIARSAGDARNAAAALIKRGELNLSLGRLAAAQDDLEEALEMISVDDHNNRVWASGVRAEVASVLGQETTRWLKPWSDRIPSGFWGVYHASARARVRIAEGDTAAARADLEQLSELAGAMHLALPGFLNLPVLRAEAVAADGDREAAVAIVDEQLPGLRRHGHRRALGHALRVRGMSDRDDRASLDALRESVSQLAGSQARLELLHSRTALGMRLRRMGQRTAAREELKLALDLAVRTGAARTADLVRAELGAAGARTRREVVSGTDALTPSERRVARLASQGMSNREIAKHLFLSRKTVEMHLGNVYRKLDIGSRSELPVALERS